MQKNDVVLVDFLDMIPHPLAGLVQALCIVDDSSLEVRTIVVVLVQLANVFVSEGLVVESDRVLVGSVSV